MQLRISRAITAPFASMDNIGRHLVTRLQIQLATIALFVLMDNTEGHLVTQLQIQHATIAPFVVMDNIRRHRATQLQILHAEIAIIVQPDTSKLHRAMQLMTLFANHAQTARMDSSKLFLVMQPLILFANHAATVQPTNKFNSHAMQHMILSVSHAQNVPIALILILIYQTMDSIAHAMRGSSKMEREFVRLLHVVKTASPVDLIHLQRVLIMTLVSVITLASWVMINAQIQPLSNLVTRFFTMVFPTMILVVRPLHVVALHMNSGLDLANILYPTSFLVCNAMHSNCVMASLHLLALKV
jgi:hypothetical protein